MRLKIKCEELEKERMERAKKMKEEMYQLHLLFK